MKEGVFMIFYYAHYALNNNVQLQCKKKKHHWLFLLKYPKYVNCIEMLSVNNTFPFKMSVVF